jgi:hypothetical protein
MQRDPENLRYFNDEIRRLRDSDQTGRSTFDGGGGGGYDHPMEERVKKLEELAGKTVERIVSIERDVAVIRSNYATKEDIKTVIADLHKEINAQTWKVVGTAALLCGAVFWLARNVQPLPSASTPAAVVPTAVPAPAAPAPRPPTPAH